MPIAVNTLLRHVMMNSNMAETCRVVNQNKVEKQCVLLASIIRRKINSCRISFVT